MSSLPFESKSTLRVPVGAASAMPRVSSPVVSVPMRGEFQPAEDEDELWRQYRTHREEAAFHAIVRRHLPAVASAARRLVNGDAALAEDICQEVFTHLAIHAAKLPPRVVLGGWLHRHTCFTAAKTLRAAVRQRSREQVAAADAVMHASASYHLHTSSPGSSSDTGAGSGFPAGPDFGSGPWAELAPHLDAALNRLPAGDRDAVVLRFFEKRGFPAMAAALNISEDAARMRTNRALEKLRRLLGRHQQARGSAAALTVASLGALLRENSVASLPIGVAGPVAADAASRVAAAALGKASAALAPAAMGAGAGVMVALRTWLVSQKTVLLGGGAVIAAAGAVWWFNHRLDSAGVGGGGLTVAAALGAKPGIPGKGGAAAAGKQVEITLDYLLVPEAQALSVLNQRWNGDGDTELRAALLKQAGGSPGGSAGNGQIIEAGGGDAASGTVRLAKSLSGTFVSGVPQTLEDAVTIKSPVAKVNPPPPGVVRRNGPEGNPDGFELRKVGTLAELNATVSDDGEWGSLKLRSTHHFAKPQTIQWSVDPPGGSGSAAAPEGNDGRRMEFRGATADLYSVQRIGSSSLIQSSQLPTAPDAAADGGPGGGAVTSSGSPVWLFTFVTLEPASSLP